ncbi:hypothetical protein AWM70_21450 [Paenibacillus yonginensis]|uniref:Uncharacterized protein n=1 Tax=Paenibacillus yonginensis TaxID=1462996 RepID=A0A1B1N5W2_9BACL|nr:hypothetical protein [Paenibacillus yonginensis]ANS76830.1 hypothetical protein AWM70_21450 [Paenibacillus yonginensis]
MYKSHVAEGRLLELHNDYVVTVQGDMISTYHRRYYMLPEEELSAEAPADPSDEKLEEAAFDRRTERKSRRERKIRWPHLSLPAFLSKDANRA